MRQFETKGLSRKALEQTYEIVLTQKLCQEIKLERLSKELSVAICAIDDKVVTDLAQIKNGLMNLLLYCETKIALEHEMTDMRSLDLIEKHEDQVKTIARNKLKGKL
jgi:hypothetical protein